MRPLQLKNSPLTRGLKCRDGTGILKTVSERKPLENFQMRSLQLKISPLTRGLKCRDGTGILKTVSERKPPGEFSDAPFAAEKFSPYKGAEV